MPEPGIYQNKHQEFKWATFLERGKENGGSYKTEKKKQGKQVCTGTSTEHKKYCTETKEKQKKNQASFEDIMGMNVAH